MNTDNTTLRLMCKPDANIMQIALDLDLDKKYKFNRIKTDDTALFEISATCDAGTLNEQHELIAKLSKDFKDDLMQINLEPRNNL